MERISRSSDKIEFLKVVRIVFLSGVVGRGTNDELSLVRSHFALGACTIALRAHCRATRSKARLVSKSTDKSTKSPE